MEKIYVTKEGLNELIKERDNLIHVVRPEVKAEHRATYPKTRTMMPPETDRPKSNPVLRNFRKC